MEQAAAAMEKVPVPTASPDTQTSEIKPTTESTPLVASASEDFSEYVEIDGVETEGPPSIFDRFLIRVHTFFNKFCHALGAFFLRGLSTLMLLTGIIASVILQMLAYYYTGVLNGWVFLACLLYAPTLGAVAVIREEMLLNGTSRTGAGPRMSQFVTFAYLIITVAGIASLFQPVLLHGENQISVKSMWTAIGGTAFFYYCMLISEVLFATALNVRRAKEEDEEQRRRDQQEPFWLASYNAAQGGRS